MQNNPRTLYISDLDGTLLNNEPELSERTIEVINKFIDDGNLFTIATARSITSCKRYLNKLNLKLPVVLHNGVFIYDLLLQKNIVSNYLSRSIAWIIAHTAKKSAQNPIVFTMDNAGTPHVFYERIANYADRYFIELRINQGDKRFRQVDDVLKYINEGSGENIISFLIQDERDKVYKLNYEINQNLKSIGIKDYEMPYAILSVDHYTNWHTLEYTSKKANKGDVILELKNIAGADKVVCFGDNRNDIPMFEASDECYAVANACDELKAKADGIIGSNCDDGVAGYIQKTIQVMNG